MTRLLAESSSFLWPI